MNIPISIITVSYNSESTIRRTIESIINQTFQSFEYIIIDGGSSDGTNKIIEEYKSILGDKLIHVSEPDKGIYDAMNKGINLAKGKIVGIVNSDDWLAPNAFEIVENSSKDQDLSNAIFCGWMSFHYKDGREQLLKTSSRRFIRHLKRYSMGVNHPATFVPLDIYKRIGLFDTNLKISADLDFIIRCWKENVVFHFVDYALTNMSDGGVSNIYSKQLNLDMKYILRKYSKNKFEYFLYLTRYSIKNKIKLIWGDKFIYRYRNLNRR